MHSLDFTQVHAYANNANGVAVPILLRSGANKVCLVASVDTGASFCLFAGELAEKLGLDLTSGERKRFRTANSSLETFVHEIEIGTMGVVTYSMLYFFADPSITTARSTWPRMTTLQSDSRRRAKTSSSWRARRRSVGPHSRGVPSEAGHN